MRFEIIMAIAVLFIAGGLLLVLTHQVEQAPAMIEQPTPAATVIPTLDPGQKIIPSGPALRSNRQGAGVPFTPQAPLGQWNDPVFQDGCEEASILMAWYLVDPDSFYGAQGHLEQVSKSDRDRRVGGTIDPQVATREIQNITDFELEHDGEFRDRSAADTAQLFKDYTKYENVFVQKDIIVEDIKAILQSGRIAIVPMNGQALRNPHYTPPGPERHMLVVHEYDANTNEFITNDPGTKFGKNYRYGAEVFYNAIRDYPTGYHESFTNGEKTMVVIGSI
jgi:hypothetical protein